MKLIKDYNIRIITAVVSLSWIYAVIRYNVLKNVEFAHLPLYVTNKSFALSAVILVCLATLKSEKHGKDYSVYLSTAGYLIAMVHMLITFILINKEYFPSLFSGGKLNIFSELSLLFGVFTFTAFTFLVIFMITRDYYRNLFGQIFTINFLNLLALTFLGFHSLLLGIKTWASPKTWPAMLPPISLIGFIAAIITIAKRLIKST